MSNRSDSADDFVDDGGGAIDFLRGRVASKRDAHRAAEALARKALERLCGEAREKFGLAAAAVWHRLGRLEVGEASVVIAVSAAHRGAAFDGCRYLIDTLKTTVPFFKKEHYADGGEPPWVGPGRNACNA